MAECACVSRVGAHCYLVEIKLGWTCAPWVPAQLCDRRVLHRSLSLVASGGQL